MKTMQLPKCDVNILLPASQKDLRTLPVCFVLSFVLNGSLISA